MGHGWEGALGVGARGSLRNVSFNRGSGRWRQLIDTLRSYPSDMDDPEQQPNPDEPQKFKARRVSLNIRIQ